MDIAPSKVDVYNYFGGLYLEAEELGKVVVGGILLIGHCHLLAELYQNRIESVFFNGYSILKLCIYINHTA